jgi:hypothetical protein
MPVDQSHDVHLVQVNQDIGSAKEIRVEVPLGFGSMDGIAKNGRTAMLTRVRATQVAGAFI